MRWVIVKLKVNPKVLRKAQSPERVTSGSFLRLAAHQAHRGNQATARGQRTKNTNPPPPFPPFPVPGEQREASATPEDYKSQQATRRASAPVGPPGWETRPQAQEPLRGKMAAPGAEVEVRPC